MIYVTHIPKRERKHALRDIYVVEPLAPNFNPWSVCPITFDRRGHPTGIRDGGSVALALDPIIEGVPSYYCPYGRRREPQLNLPGHCP